MDKLAALHAGATTTQARTAEKLGPHSPIVYKLGKLLITSVSLRDSGLKGGKGLLLEPQQEYIGDPELDKELQGLGLPTSFGSGNKGSIKNSVTHTSKRKGAAAADAQETNKQPPPGSNGSAMLEKPQPSHPAQPAAGSATATSTASFAPPASVQPDIFQDPAIISAAVRRQQSAGPESHTVLPSAQHHPPAAHTGGLPPSLLQPQPQPQTQPQPLAQHPQGPQIASPPLQGLVQVVHILNAHGFNLPLVWHAMGLQMTPATVTPADIYAAAQVAGAPAELVHHALAHAMQGPGLLPGPGPMGPTADASGPGPGANPSSVGPAISCAALEQRLNSLSLDSQPQPGLEGPRLQTHAPHSQPHQHPHLHPSPSGPGPLGPNGGPMMANSHAPIAQVPPGMGAGHVRMDSPWQQGFDPSTGHFYYFNVAAQITQWEVPAEGYRPRMMSMAAVEQGMLQHPGMQQEAIPHAHMLHHQPHPHLAHLAHAHHPLHHLQPDPGPCVGPNPGLHASHPHSLHPAHPQHLPHLQHHAHAHPQPQPEAPQPSHHPLSQPQAATHQPQPHQPPKPVHSHGLNGRHSQAKANGNHNGSSKPNPNHTWQQLELLQQVVDRPDGYASPCLEGEEQERVEIDSDTAAYVRSILPRNMAKYWLQRYSLFSKYDDGVQMDTEGWYSVTPEVLALHQAQMCKRYGRGHIIADAMAGCGGNVIQMAMVFPEVIGVEISPRRCGMAEHNTQLYGVGPRVNMLCADFFAVAPGLVADAIFVSPPWGGPAYQYCETFDVLAGIEGYRSVAELLSVCLSVVHRAWHGKSDSTEGAPDGASAGTAEDRLGKRDVEGRGVVSLFLPRNTDLQQLETLVPQGAVWLVERNFLNGKLKGVTVYCF